MSKWLLVMACLVLVSCATSRPKVEFGKVEDTIDISYAQPIPDFGEVVEIEDGEVTEASGLAGSLRHWGVFWIINDSGNAPYLHAVGADGRALGRVMVNGVRNRDWEDLASFRYRGVPHLVIPDVGDNMSSRDSVQLHFVAEPLLGSQAVSPLASVTVRYEDGAHNCEGVAVDVDRDAIYLAAKGKSDHGIYQLSLSECLRGGSQTARWVSQIQLEVPSLLMGIGKLARHNQLGQQVTGLDYSLVKGRAAWLSYTHAYVTPGVLATQVAAQRGISYPSLVQAEAIALPEWDSGAVWVASEGRPGVLVRLAIP